MLLFTFAGQSEWIVLFLFGGTQWKNKKSKSLRSCQWSCQRRSSWTTPLKPCRNLYEPMSVSHILRLGQKESRWTPQQESSGIRFYRFLMRSSQISRRILRSCTFTKSGFQHRSLPQFGLHHPRTGLLLPLWRGRMRNIRHRVPVPVPAHCYNPPPHHKIPYTP